MALTRWWNPSLPQTLLIAVVLLYADAVFGVIFGSVLFFPLGTAIVVGSAAAGLGIANEKRWGWVTGVVVTSFGLLWGVIGFAVLGGLSGALNLMFAVAKFALLLHPQSREHQKIWFT